jgi:hypothetical protein
VDQQDDEAGEEDDRDEMQSTLQVGKGREDAPKGGVPRGREGQHAGDEDAEHRDQALDDVAEDPLVVAQGGGDEAAAGDADQRHG